MVGAVGFEPTTSCSQGRRANQAALRPDSCEGINLNQGYVHHQISLCKGFMGIAITFLRVAVFLDNMLKPNLTPT